MNQLVLNKDVVLESDKVVITEQIQTNYTKQQIEDRLMIIQRNKTRIMNENAMLVEEYNKLLEQEVEFKGYLAELSINQAPEIIE